jgi:EpsI family protein
MPARPRDPSRRRFVLVIGVLAVGAAITLLLPLLNGPISGVKYARLVSAELGGWIGIERPIDEHTAAILQTDDVMDREYAKPNEQHVDLTVIFAKEQRKVAHPQEICLKGAGYSVQSYSRPFIPTGMADPAQVRVIRLEIERGGLRYLVYYWYKCGDHYTASYYWENVLIIWSQLTLRPANGALIKLTTPIDQDIATSDKRLAAFIALAMPEIAQKLP